MPPGQDLRSMLVSLRRELIAESRAALERANAVQVMIQMLEAWTVNQLTASGIAAPAAVSGEGRVADASGALDGVASTPEADATEVMLSATPPEDEGDGDGDGEPAEAPRPGEVQMHLAQRVAFDPLADRRKEVLEAGDYVVHSGMPPDAAPPGVVLAAVLAPDRSGVVMYECVFPDRFSRLNLARVWRRRQDLVFTGSSHEFPRKPVVRRPRGGAARPVTGMKAAPEGGVRVTYGRDAEAFLLPSGYRHELPYPSSADRR